MDQETCRNCIAAIEEEQLGVMGCPLSPWEAKAAGRPSYGLTGSPEPTGVSRKQHLHSEAVLGTRPTLDRDTPAKHEGFHGLPFLPIKELRRSSHASPGLIPGGSQKESFMGDASK